MTVRSVINPLKEKIIFYIDLSIQFSGTTSEAMPSKIFIKVAMFGPLQSAYLLDLMYMTQTL